MLEFVIGCKGRLAFLKQTLPRLAAQPACRCVVVDYSCPDGARAWVAAHFPRVKVVSVPGQPKYVQGHARNLGARAATAPWLGFIDADVLVAPDFAVQVLRLLRPGHFYRVSEMTDWGLYGTFLCMREDFERAGGYDEVFEGWGDCDVDLYQALERAGVKPAAFPVALVRHIEHGDDERLKHYEVKDRRLNHSVNRLYRLAKVSLVRLGGAAMPVEVRQGLYRAAAQTVYQAARDGRSERLNLALGPGDAMPDLGWKLHGALTYRYRPPGVTAEDGPLGDPCVRDWLTSAPAAGAATGAAAGAAAGAADRLPAAAGGPALEFIVTCKGRLAYLRQTLGRLAAQPGCGVVVVDYSCPDGTAAWVAEHFPQVEVVSEPGQAFWNHSQARNLGARVATAGWLGFFDADVLVEPDFAWRVLPQLRPGHYYRASQPADRGLMGSFLCAREDFERAGGYDEALQGWGYEDVDLFAALERAGVQPGAYAASLVRHLPHGDEERGRHCADKDIRRTYTVNRLYQVMKSHLARLCPASLPLEERQRLHRLAADAVARASRERREVLLGVDLGSGDDMPSAGWTIERALTYRCQPPPGELWPS